MTFFKRLTFMFLVFIFAMLPATITPAHGQTQIAFVRNDDLWIQLSGQEKELTQGAYVRYPKWSQDGRYLAYLEGMNSDHLWIYDTKTSKKKMFYQTGVNYYEWSPVNDQLAFTSGKVLNMIDPTHWDEAKFKNVMLGVGNFSWMPDGQGFMTSSEANLEPTGWSQVKLFKVPINANMDPKKATLFYTLPERSEQFFAISTSPFKWSKDGKWMSFIGVPTASLSADSDTLCVLSSDGKEFIPVDRMLMDQEWYQWAPTKDWLAYIEGTGRFAVENKHLKVKKLQATTTPSYTPKGFVDRGFTWVGDDQVVISRAKETKWHNDPKRRPLPSLFSIDVSTGQEKQLTKPEAGQGDFNPIYKNDHLYWARSNRQSAQLMVSTANGQKVLVKKMDAPPEYYENRDWQAILSIY